MRITKFAYFYLLFIFSVLLTPSIAAADTHPVNNHLSWSGINWYVNDASESNTWVDSSGNLHMQLQKIGDKWYGATLESPYTVKYGKFTWVASSPSLNLERGTSIGLMTYADDYHEIDIEINQWPGCDEHLYLVNQPGSVEDHPDNVNYGILSDNPHLNDKNIEYSIDWKPTSILISAIANDGTIISIWDYTNADAIPHVNSSVVMDILPLARTYYPASGNTAEIVLSNFTYTPFTN